MNKKKVVIMRNVEKIKLKQNSLSSKFIIKAVFYLLGLTLVVGLVHAFGLSFSVIVGIYLGYRALRLIMRLFGLVIALIYTAILLAIVIIINYLINNILNVNL